MKNILLVYYPWPGSCNSPKNKTSATPDKFVIENLIKYNSEEKENYPDANVYEAIGIFKERTEELP